MFTSIARSITTCRGFAGLAAMTLAAALLLGNAATVSAQTVAPETPAPVDPTVDPVPIEPGYSTMGMFLDDSDNSNVVYIVTNLEHTTWNGYRVVIGYLYNCATGSLEFMLVVPTAAGQVAGFTGSVTFAMWVGTNAQGDFGSLWTGPPPTEDQFGPVSGKYVPL